MNIDLTPLIESIAAKLGDRWGSLAQDAYESIPAHSPVWPRFAVWFLQEVSQSASPENQAAIDQVRRLYERVLAGEQPRESDWQAACSATHNRGRLAWSAWQTARVALMGFKRHVPLVGFRRMGKGGLVFVSAEYAADAISTAAAWSEKPEFTTVRYACRLLLELYLERQPRNATEAGLQQAVLEDESTLPIYCDYLEEQGDEAAGWLRPLTLS